MISGGDAQETVVSDLEQRSRILDRALRSVGSYIDRGNTVSREQLTLPPNTSRERGLRLAIFERDGVNVGVFPILERIGSDGEEVATSRGLLYIIDQGEVRTTSRGTFEGQRYPMSVALGVEAFGGESSELKVGQTDQRDQMKIVDLAKVGMVVADGLATKLDEQLRDPNALEIVGKAADAANKSANRPRVGNNSFLPTGSKSSVKI